ncbi:hypothetical protein PR048_009305 [Dryococelus australis]|uniref:Uncharacterized protein n=1 Tax=Dryococelus australis TaxID=614101 RepID=A0ABQ9HZI1_9NEOP|nr:hypothetical protein PR048_009305 [Dryococelus australis]
MTSEATDYMHTLMCKFCKCRVAFERRHTVALEVLKKEKLTSSILHIGQQRHLRRQIYLQKLDDPNIRVWFNEFVEVADKICGFGKIAVIIKIYAELFVLPGSGDMPCVKTLREKYTTDNKGRCVYVILFQILSEPVVEPQVVIASVNFLAKADATTCAQNVLKSMELFTRTSEALSHTTRYMTKYANSLQVLYGEHILHIQSWAHKLAIVGNVLSCELSQANDVVVKVKSAFLNTRKRKHLYLQEETSKPANMFPMPVNTVGIRDFVQFSTWQNIFWIINFFRDSELQERNNAEIRYSTMLSDKDVHYFSTSKYATYHTLYGDTENKQKALNCEAIGIFSNTFENSSVLKKINIRDIAHVKYICQKVTSLCMNKLQTLMKSEPCAHVYRSLNQLFNPKNLLLNDAAIIVTTKIHPWPLKKIDNVDLSG